MHRLHGYQGQEQVTWKRGQANEKAYGESADDADVGQQQMRYLRESFLPVNSLNKYSNWSALQMHRQETASDYASSQ